MINMFMGWQELGIFDGKWLDCQGMDQFLRDIVVLYYLERIWSITVVEFFSGVIMCIIK